jgi:dipeptidase E
LKDRLAAGALYIGSSAGSIVTGPDIAFIRDMDDEAVANLTSHQGMGLVDFTIIPHMDHTELGTIVQAIHAKADMKDQVFALKDNEGLIVRGANVEVVSVPGTRNDAVPSIENANSL